MLDQFFDPADEVAAELVDNVCLDVGPMLVRQLGQGHPVQAGRLR